MRTNTNYWTIDRHNLHSIIRPTLKPGEVIATPPDFRSNDKHAGIRCHLLQWCCDNLAEENIEECQNEAIEVARRELNEEEAYAKCPAFSPSYRGKRQSKERKLMTNQILKQLALNTKLLPREVSQSIFADNKTPFDDIIMDLLICAMDADVLIRNDSDAAWTEKRISRQNLAVASLAALALSQALTESPGEQNTQA